MMNPALVRAVALVLAFVVSALASPPVRAQSLRAYQYQAVNLLTGQPLPGAKVTVYNWLTTTRASLFDSISGAPIANPMTADANGLVAFQASAANSYQAIWSSGAYTSPLWSVLANGGALPALSIGSVTFTTTPSLAGVTLSGTLPNPFLSFVLPRGTQIWSTAGTPTCSTGGALVANGDYAIDPVTYALFGPRDSITYGACWPAGSATAQTAAAAAASSSAAAATSASAAAASATAAAASAASTPLVQNALQGWRTSLASIDKNLTTARAVVAFVGDSWTFRDMITGPLRERIQARYGNAGVGWLTASGAGYPAYWPAGMTYAQTGTWATGTFGPDLSSATSSTTSSTITISGVFETAVCIYRGKSGGGSFTWSVDGGATTTVNTSATTGAQAFTISGLATGATHSLVFSVSAAGSTGVELSGCDFRIETEGVRVHRLGVPGSQASGLLAALSAADFNVMINTLGVNAAVVMFGTNEMNANVAPATYSANLLALAAQIKNVSAAPNADVVFAAPSDNGQTGKTYTMAQYADAMRLAAAGNGYGFIDAFSALGSYQKELATGAFNVSDVAHPTIYGGQAIANVIARHLLDTIPPEVAFNGVRSTFVGMNAGLPFFVGSGRAGPGGAITTGYDNVALGFKALSAATTAYGNTAVGSQAGQNMSTGYSNTAIGAGALQLATAANQNTAGGFNALQRATGNLNSAWGAYASYLLTTGAFNASFGANAGYSNVGGVRNVAFGANARFSGANDNFNTAVGESAQYTASGGSSNTSVGRNSLYDLTTGDLNTTVGVNAGRGLTTGRANTIVGPCAGFSATQSNSLAFCDGDATMRADYGITNVSAWTFSKVAIGGAGSPTFTTGAGAPSATEPNGSVYVRSDGAKGSQVYTSSGSGAWLPVGLPRSYLAGLTLSNNGASPNSVLDVAAGQAADSNNAVMINLSAITKSTAGAWASGSGANGMGAGLTIANSTWYHVCAAIIAGNADVFFDTSAACANQPASTTAVRRIGSFKTNGSAQILAFKQNGDFFYWGASVLDQNAVSPGGTSMALYAVSAPTGVKTRPIMRFAVTAGYGVLASPDEPSETVSSTPANASADTSSGWGIMQDVNFVYTNTSGQVGVVVNNAANTFSIRTRGYVDDRGRLN